MIKRLRVRTSPRFRRKFKQLSKSLKTVALEEIDFFREHPLQQSLRVHRLKEKFSGLHSFSVLPNLRIIFRFIRKDHSEVLFYDIGGHEIYK